MTDPNLSLPHSSLQSGFRTNENRLFQIDDAHYIAIPLSNTPKLDFPNDKIAPVTVIAHSLPSDLNQSWVQQLVDGWSQTDDVFRHEFLQNIIFLTSKEQKSGIDNIRDELRASLGTEWSTVVQPDVDEHDITSGPFVMWNGQLCKAFRLYDDPQQAFVVATKPHFAKGSFGNLRVSGNYYSALSVAVPSRIGSLSSGKGPLAGARFAVKDLFEIEGLRLTVGCRAWYDLAQTNQKTAPLIQKLLDGGAHLLGTLKLGSLITREEPAESADYFAAFNPRGDGYQSAWSSSGGSGASLASYDWLDFTLGTDTTGSSRRPALANGLFQLRISKEKLPFEGVVPSWFPFDSPAMYSRDISKLEKWVGAWISADTKSFSSKPTILWPTDFWPIANVAQQELVEGFVVDLEKTHGVKRTEVSIKDLWRKKTPKEADSSDIEEYLKDVGVTSFCYGVYEELQDFRNTYREKYSKEPYVNPTMRWRWDAAKNVTREQYDDAVQRLNVYKAFVINNVLEVGEKESILILPITSQAVDYRDEPVDPPSAPKAFDGIWLAPILSAPELSVPIGEIEYESRVSQRTEHLPIVVSVLGAPGADMKLLDAIIRTLEQADRKTTVSTGSKMGFTAKYVRRNLSI